MMWILIIVAVLLLVWVLMNLKTSRPDGDYIRNIHPYRRIMAYIMPTRVESVVFFDTHVKADRLLEFVQKAREDFHVDITHCLVAAAGVGLAENPKMNQFVIGRRMYQRKGRFVTFSMKRAKGDKKAKLATVKLELKDGESFRDFCGRINEQIGVERSDEVTYADKEFALFNAVPRALMVKLVRFFYWLDYHNLLPNSFIKNDGLYTSMFIANLGSVKMGAGYHHLYEWGNCPLFMMTGAIEERPVVVDGELTTEKILPIRWTYDERIDDGLTASHGITSVKNALEDPFNAFV